MLTCMQTTDQNVLQHGLSVRERYLELRSHLIDGTALSGWRLPEWIGEPIVKKVISEWDDSLLELYQVYHDCGKPHCRTVDDEGRQHFPDHARVSATTWLDHPDHSEGALAVGRLISMDMDAHLLRAHSVDEFASRPEAIPLLLTALAEVHSNASMFGGIDSVGFKIKWKVLDRMGRRVIFALVAQR